MTENLQYRLYNASIDPPADAWPKIAGQLDQTVQEHLAHKLQEAELEPPANAWENIMATLDADKRAPLIPMYRNWKKWAVASVAASIIIIAGLLYFRPTPTTGKETVSATNPQTENNQGTNSPGNNTSTPNNDSVGTEEYADIRQPRRALRRSASTNTSQMLAFAGNRNAPVRYAHVDETASGSITNEQRVHLEEVIDQSISMHAEAYIAPKKYLTVAAPNGQPAKISAKFTDAVGFVFNNEPTESLDMAIRSFSWQQRFRNWSNKLMSNAAFIPAATNFLDIIELEELLKE